MAYHPWAKEWHRQMIAKVMSKPSKLVYTVTEGYRKPKSFNTKKQALRCVEMINRKQNRNNLFENVKLDVKMVTKN